MVRGAKYLIFVSRSWSGEPQVIISEPKINVAFEFDPIVQRCYEILILY